MDRNAWASHLQDIQEKKINNNNTISGLSKAYCEFKKMLNKMEEENEAEQIQEEPRAESRAELPAISRPVSNVSRSDSRWIPLRRSSNTLPIRLNSWTVENLEPTSMESFSENTKEEEEALSLNDGQVELKDGDSLHDTYILERSFLPDVLQNQRDYST